MTGTSGSDERTYEAVWHSRAALTRVYQRRHLALIAAATDDAVRKLGPLQRSAGQRETAHHGPRGNSLASSQSARTKLDRLDKEIDSAEQEACCPRLPVLKHYEELARLGPDALRKLLPEDAVLIDLLRYTHFEQDPNRPGIEGREAHASATSPSWSAATTSSVSSWARRPASTRPRGLARGHHG